MKFIGVLSVSPEVKQRINTVKAHANVYRQTLTDIFRRAGNGEPVGKDQNFAIEIPVGFRVVYSIDQLPDPAGWCEHVSIGQTIDGKVIPPPPSLVRTVFLPLFDLNPKKLVHVWLEEFTGW